MRLLRFVVSSRSVHAFAQTPQNFIECRVEFNRCGRRSRGRGHQNQIAAAQIRLVAARMKSVSLAQAPLRPVAVVRFPLFFRHNERGANEFRLVAAKMRARLNERMPHDLRLIERAVELSRCQAVLAGNHRGSLAVSRT